MNCRDANGNCTGGAGCAARTVRSCDELGLCQGRTPRCPGCAEEDAVLSYAAFQLLTESPRTPTAFAPGTIESYRARFWTPARRRSLLRTLLICSAAGAILAVSAFFAGLIVGAIP